MQKSLYNGLPAISAFIHNPLVGYIKTVSIGYIWRVKNEGRRKRNVYFSIYTHLLLLSSCSVVSDSTTPWTAVGGDGVARAGVGVRAGRGRLLGSQLISPRTRWSKSWRPPSGRLKSSTITRYPVAGQPCQPGRAELAVWKEHTCVSRSCSQTQHCASQFVSPCSHVTPLILTKACHSGCITTHL